MTHSSSVPFPTFSTSLLNRFPCERPQCLAIEIVPGTACARAIGRCGHPITTRQELMIKGTSIRLYDSAAAMYEPRRHRTGFRPLGPLGFLFRRSLSRCDACRRKQELENTIVCPCSRTIAPRDPVVLVTPRRAMWHGLAFGSELVPFITHTVTDLREERLAVMGYQCAVLFSGMPNCPTTFIWSGTSVINTSDFGIL